MNQHTGRSLVVLVLSVALSLAFVRTAPNTIFNVDSFDDLPDALPGDGACATNPPPAPVCTLRAAVQEANAHPGPDFISLPPGVYTLKRVGYDANAENGDLDIIGDLTIYTTGGRATIDANAGKTFDRAFEVTSGSLSLSDLTIQHGYSPSNGGGISANGSLQLYNTIVQSNTAAMNGGGIFAAGALVSLTSVTLRANNSQNAGGGISIEGSSSPYPNIFVSDSTFEGNRSLAAGSSGGAVNIYTSGGGINHSTFHDNTAGQGGALSYTAAVVGVRLDITQSTFISNSAVSTSGGALFLYGNTSLNSSQVISNVAPSAGGIYAYFGTHTLNDVQVTNNYAQSYACGGVQVSSGNLNMNRGVVAYNQAPELGGGLCTGGAGSIRMAITDTVVMNNRANVGAGVFASNYFLATRSAIYSNFATNGGGVYAQGRAVFDDSTVANNYAVRNGGGIYADPLSTVHLNSSTVAGNSARTGWPGPGIGGGVYISGTAAVSATNSLLAMNNNNPMQIAPSDCTGTLISEGYNFIGSNGGCTITGDPTGNHVGTNYPFSLDPMVYSFGTTPGIPPGFTPKPGSPLIDMAENVGCISGTGLYFLFVDQIGHYRAANGRCDIGAIEYFNILRLWLPLVRR
jgi:CSLREA domain-containing protein